MCRKLIYLCSFVLVLSLILASMAEAADPNLVGWWKLDGDVLDSSGNGRNGTIHGNPLFVPGYDSDALELHGDPDYVAIDGYKGVLGPHAFSITAWIKTNDDQGEIVGWGSTGRGNRMEFRINNNRLRLEAGGGYVQGDTDVNDSEWHHVAATVKENATLSSGDITLYLDGQDDTRPVSRSNTIHPVSDFDVKFGCRYNNEGRWYEGLIDDVRIYDRMLSPADMREFASSPKAGYPSPADGAIHEDTNVMLSWSPGMYAALHDVYFGTDSSNLLLVSRNQPLDSNSYGPVAVELGWTYYWQIDEVNDAHPDSPWEGKVWSFEVKDYILLDNFESYADTNALRLTWADGTSNSTGSVISLEPVFDSNSIKCIYDNSTSPFYSEADLTYDTAQDWTRGGVKALELRFHGDANNVGDQMYVALEDAGGNSAAVAHSNPNALIQEEWENWQVWNIALQDFYDKGMDLTKIKKLIIGFSDGGSGIVCIDDIRLYPPRCLPEYIPTSFNDDCVVDYEDLDVVVRNWLVSDYSVVAEEPDNNRLQAHYKFDKPSGTTAYDSSGKDYHATVDANGAKAWDPGGYDGGCLDFDGTFSVSVPKDVFSNVYGDQTISVWINVDVNANPNTIGRVEHGAGPADPDAGWDRLTWIQEEPKDYVGQWRHYAFVKNSAVGTMRIYNDGLLVAQDTEASLPMSGAGARPSRIGAGLDGTSSYYKGKLDDFRVYDCALSHAQVLYLAKGSGSELYQPLQPVLSSVDPFADGKIDFKDFAVLADVWLEYQQWP